jgi:hypothetical protein
MTVVWSAIPGAIFSPGKTFKKISRNATVTDGLVLVTVFAVLSGILTMIGMLPMINQPYPVPEMGAVMIGVSVFSAFIGIIMSIVAFLIFGLLSKHEAKAFGGTGSLDKTLGLMGYAYCLNFVFAIINTAIILLSWTTIEIEGILVPQIGITGLLAILGIALINFIWTVIIQSHAVGAANGISAGKGFLSMLMAVFIIIGIITITAIILAAIWAVLTGALALPSTIAFLA